MDESLKLLAVFPTRTTKLWGWAPHWHAIPRRVSRPICSAQHAESGAGSIPRDQIRGSTGSRASVRRSCAVPLSISVSTK